MSKFQAFANNLKQEARQGARAPLEFFRLKTRQEDFNYLPMPSRLRPVRAVAVTRLKIADKAFTRYGYEPVRGARARV